jgi:monoamine oxidase
MMFQGNRRGMSQDSESLDFDVLIVGAGAAGIAAGLRLMGSGLRFLIIEGRLRAGGRATTVLADGFPLDLGCGWLHSADRNPWHERLVRAGFTIDKTPPGWGEQSLDLGFSAEDQAAFGKAWGALYHRLAQEADATPDRPASTLLEPGGRFNLLFNAISTYISGVELDGLSIRDWARYADSGVNWRAVEGYGAGIVAQATQPSSHLPVKLGCHVARIDHRGAHLRIVTTAGTLSAKSVIVTAPPNLLLAEKLVFDPPLPEKLRAAAGLPLGLANKLFIKIDAPELLPKDGHLFGRTDRTETAGYHLRPFGRGLIEAYFGGRLAAGLEQAGEGAFFDFACEELTHLFGADFRHRLKPIIHSAWGGDSYAHGAYSYALPGCADARSTLAETVDDRIFFAGEACSREDFSTAHGAFWTGQNAADGVLATFDNPAPGNS